MLPLILCIAISGCNKKQITEETETKTKKTQITTTEYQKTRKISKSSWIIELDPGHGGIDSGAVGTSHDWPQEKEINLKIAKYVKKNISTPIITAIFPKIKMELPN